MLRIILVTVLLASSAIATTFDSCTDGGAAPTAVAVAGCAEQPCDFAPGTKVVVDVDFTVGKRRCVGIGCSRGTKVVVDVDFTVDEDVSALAAHVFATVQGLTIEYTLDNPNACELLKDSTCPLDDGEAATYHLEVEIPDITLKSEVLLKFYLEDQSSERVTCFQLDGQVRAGIHFLFSNLLRRTTRTVNMLRIIIVTVLLASSAIAIIFDSCTDGGAAPIDVTVTGCTEPPCNFVSGTIAEINVTFTADEDMSALTAHVFVTTLGMTFEYKPNNPDACKQMKNSTCPLKVGDSVTLEAVMNVPQVTFETTFTIKVYLVDQNGKRVICFRLNGKIN
uniref:MD-2-related lipid-recognition domain-containing protein n=1 Tax=Timema genevievae TaxID=629358 RepID=A0A7R9PSD2_TIMGE|nr:unnamed protein product [Timema genevievae]